MLVGVAIAIGFAIAIAVLCCFVVCRQERVVERFLLREDES